MHTFCRFLFAIFQLSIAKGKPVERRGRKAKGPVNGSQLHGNRFYVIAVTSMPTKTEYKEGETLETAGLVVTGYYTVPGFDGTISKVISGYTTGTWYNSAGTHEITVSYEGKTAKFNVTVVAKTLDRIAVTTMPSQTTYDKINESLSLSTTGIVVKAYYLSLTTMPQASPSPTLRRPLATRISQTPSP